MIKRLKLNFGESISKWEVFASFFIAYFLSLLAATMFFELSVWLWLLSFFFALFIAKALLLLLFSRRERQARRNLMLFLQFLSSNLAAGRSLRATLRDMESTAYFAQCSDKQLRQNLRRVSAKIRHQEASAAILPLLESCFPCAEAKALLYSLRLENQLGEKLLNLLRSSFDTSRELLMLEDELRAAANKQRSEALILTLLPFFMAPLFNDLISLPEPSAGLGLLAPLMRLLAFLLAMVALFLNLRLDARSDNNHQVKLAEPQLLGEHGLAKPFFALGRKLYLILPSRYHQRLTRHYRLAYPRYFYNRAQGFFESLVLRHLATSLCITGASLLLMLSLRLLVVYPIFLALVPTFGVSIFLELRLQTQAKLNETAIRRELPLMLSLLSRLLANSFSLMNALKECAEILAADSALGILLRDITLRAAHAAAPEQMIEDLAAQLQLSDVASLLYSLARYVSLGSHEILQLLDKQLALCWSEQRQNSRKLLDTKSSLLLIPMLMDLLAVMLIGAAPAMQVFSSF